MNEKDTVARRAWFPNDRTEPLNVERENAAAAYTEADRDTAYPTSSDRVHEAFVSGAEWQRDQTRTLTGGVGE